MKILLLIGFIAYWSVAIRLFKLSMDTPELKELDAPMWAKVMGPALHSLFWPFGLLVFLLFDANTEVDDV